jgi:hypothetical protein
MKIADLLGLGGGRQRSEPPRPVRPNDLPTGEGKQFSRTPRVLRWAWASAVTTGIVMALSSGQAVSRSEVLQLLKAVTALVEEEDPARAKDRPEVPPLDGPPIYVPDPKWDR